MNAFNLGRGGDWSFQLLAGLNRNHWVENLPSVNRQVSEWGLISSVEFSIQRDTLFGRTEFGLYSAEGARKYQGWSTGGLKVRSTTDINQSEMLLLHVWKLRPTIGLGVRAEVKSLTRKIQGTNSALGYAERFQRPVLLIGGERFFNQPYEHAWSVAAWFGVGRAGRMKLRAPSFDESRLKLGDERLAEVSITWTSPERAGDGYKQRLKARVLHSHSEISRGNLETLSRFGVAIGTLYQPRTIQKNWSFMVGFEHEW